MHTFIYTYVEIIVWWQLQNYVTNVNQWLSTCYSALLNSYFWSFKHETSHFPKPWMLDSLLKIIWKHFSTICLQLDVYFFFSSGLFLIADSTGINFLRYVKILENSTTGSHFRYFGFILVDLTGLYSHQTCISDNDLSHSLFQHVQSRNWNNNLWH